MQASIRPQGATAHTGQLTEQPAQLGAGATSSGRRCHSSRVEPDNCGRHMGAGTLIGFHCSVMSPSRMPATVAATQTAGMRAVGSGRRAMAASRYSTKAGAMCVPSSCRRAFMCPPSGVSSSASKFSQCSRPAASARAPAASICVCQMQDVNFLQ